MLGREAGRQQHMLACNIGAAVAASSSGRYATSTAIPRNDCCGACMGAGAVEQ